MSQMSLDEIKSKTKSYISGHFKNYELNDDDDIFSLGFVNSLFAMQLVMFVEKEFQLKVSDDDLMIDNFRSVNAVMDLVTKKLSPAAISA
jgi:methoxymalonate biosynthesis acyl carrier protein